MTTIVCLCEFRNVLYAKKGVVMTLYCFVFLMLHKRIVLLFLLFEIENIIYDIDTTTQSTAQNLVSGDDRYTD